MIDRLRWLANRPIRDSDRPRIFVALVALLLAAAGALALINDPAPPTRRPSPASTPQSTQDRSPALPPRPSTTAAPSTLSEEASPAPSQRPRAEDIARSKQSARRFLRQFLPFSYGRAPAATVTVATSALRADLARTQPRVPAREQRRRARVQLLQTNAVTSQHADLTAVISDRRRRYTLRLQLANTASGWLVTAVEH